MLIYCIPKGSIAFDGISLTIAKISDNIVDVALIPHTLEHTNLSNKQIGDSVNIETDIIGKYIYQFIYDFETIMVSPNYNDLETGYSNITNIGSFVDMIILQELSKNVDAYRLSTYIYKDIDSRTKFIQKKDL